MATKIPSVMRELNQDFPSAVKQGIHLVKRLDDLAHRYPKRVLGSASGILLTSVLACSGEQFLEAGIAGALIGAGIYLFSRFKGSNDPMRYNWRQLEELIEDNKIADNNRRAHFIGITDPRNPNIGTRGDALIIALTSDLFNMEAKKWLMHRAVRCYKAQESIDIIKRISGLHRGRINPAEKWQLYMLAADLNYSHYMIVRETAACAVLQDPDMTSHNRQTVLRWIINEDLDEPGLEAVRQIQDLKVNKKEKKGLYRIAIADSRWLKVRQLAGQGLDEIERYL